MACDRDSLEPGMNVERFHEVADVIPHRLDTEVQLPGNLIGRTPALEQTKDLALARCQVWMRRRRRLILEILHLAEDADHVAAAFERNGTHLRRDALAVGC